MKPPVAVTSQDETDMSYVETAEEKIFVHSPPPVEAVPTLNASFDEDPEREERIGKIYRLECTSNKQRRGAIDELKGIMILSGIAP